MSKAYIAGKITHDPDYRAKFATAGKYLRSRGYVVMSPAIMPDGFDYEDYMHICFAMMWVCRAGTAFFLPDWKDSPGARREHENAQKTGMKIEYLTWEEMWADAGIFSVEIDLPHKAFSIDSNNYTTRKQAKRSAESLAARMGWK
jgi:hypothetical protein